MPDALAQLKDIHLAEPIGWWPLAFGYYVIVALLLVIVALLLIRRFRYRVRRYAKLELNTLMKQYAHHGDEQRFAQDVSVLMRRTLMTLRPREDVAGLTGERWLEALQRLVAHKAYQFSDATKNALEQAIYQPQANIDAKQLMNDSVAWINALPPQKGWR